MARAGELAGRWDTEPGSARDSLVATNLLQGVREQIEQWQQLGNLYADTLEDPATAPALRYALRAELEALEEAAGQHVCDN